VREAANEGVFTPSSHLRPHIQFPGAWGGANWGSTAGDPQTGMVYVRSLEMINAKGKKKLLFGVNDAPVQVYNVNN